MSAADSPGLSLRESGPVDRIDADVRLNAGTGTPPGLWRTIAATDRFERRLVEAVRDLLADCHHSECVPTLLDAGVTTIEGGYARLVTGFDLAPESVHYERARMLTRQFGQGEVTVLGHRLTRADLVDDLLAGPLAILQAAAVVPTITVAIGEAFRERRRTDQEETCQLLAALATACEVVVVTTGATAAWLAHEFGEHFPRSFSEQRLARRECDTPVDDLAEQARDALDPDGRAVRILRLLGAEPSETLSYHELVSMQDVSRARVSQLLGDLESLSLVERYGPRTDQHVDLLPAGKQLLERIDEEIGRQRRLDSLFSEPGQSSDSAVCSAPHGRGSPDAPSETPPGESAGAPYRTRYFGRAEHAAAAGAATEGDIVAVAGAIPKGDHTRFVSYEAERNETVVAVHASTPLQYMTSASVFS